MNGLVEKTLMNVPLWCGVVVGPHSSLMATSAWIDDVFTDLSAENLEAQQ